MNGLELSQHMKAASDDVWLLARIALRTRSLDVCSL